MALYRKIPDMVHATRLPEDAESQTLASDSGDLVASPGDWIVRGAEGDGWPVKPDAFPDLYEHVEGDRYRKLPVELDARQHPRDAEPFRLTTLEGTITVEPGDWIITGVNGERHACKPDYFRATYERVGDVESTST